MFTMVSFGGTDVRVGAKVRGRNNGTHEVHYFVSSVNFIAVSAVCSSSWLHRRYVSRRALCKLRVHVAAVHCPRQLGQSSRSVATNCSASYSESLHARSPSPLSSWCDRYSDRDLIVAGDFNRCLDSSSDPVSCQLNRFISHYMLRRCDMLFPGESPATYIDEALNQQSYIDYVLVTCQDVAAHFASTELSPSAPHSIRD